MESTKPSSSLIEQVKAAQRASDLWKEIWHQLCDTLAQGVRDPARLPTEFLQNFLTQIRGNPGGKLQSTPAAVTNVAKRGVNGERQKQPPPQTSLVEQVKQAQKISQDCRQAWHEYCDAVGEGVRDPGRHSTEFLEAFLESIGDPSMTESTASQELVDRIKEVQKSSAIVRGAWHLFCDTEGSGVRDPSAHPDTFLEEFLKSHGFAVPVGPSAPVGTQTLRKQVSKEKNAVPTTQASNELVEQVKEMQRRSTHCMEIWRLMCESNGNNVRDPARHEPAFLHRFLTKCRGVQEQDDPEPDAPLGLVEEVKRVQSLSAQHRHEWHHYCDTQGDRVRDPARHRVEFLEGFLVRMGVLTGEMMEEKDEEELDVEAVLIPRGGEKLKRARIA